MNYRDTFSKFEVSRHYLSFKTQVPDIENKDFNLSPRLSNPDREKFEHTKNPLSQTRSPEVFKQKTPVPRTISNSKSTSSNPKILEIEAENKNLKEKVETLQRERDIIKTWKRGKKESSEYKEKLNFLVRNIQQFLQSSLKFQNMLREKLGVNVASLYEEERNLFKSQVASATRDSDIHFKHSPFNSPLRTTKSPRIEELSSIDSEGSRMLEELKAEKIKTRRLQSELTVEMAKKDEEMKNIRDRIVELEKIEKGKLENEKNFARAREDWNIERKENLKEIEKYKNEVKKMKEKLCESEQIYLDLKDDSSCIKEKCEEMIQENYKLSESLQTYDRLYNYSKKWAEKAVDEVRNSLDAQIDDVRARLEQEEKRLAKSFNVLQMVDINKEKQEIARERQKVWVLEQEIAGYQKKIKEETNEKIRISSENEKNSAELKKSYEKTENLENQLKKISESNMKFKETCEKLTQDCSKYTSQIQSLYKEKSNLEKFSENIQNSQDELKKTLQNKQQDFDELKEKEKHLKKSLIEKDEEILELKTTVEGLEMNIESLKTSIKDLKDLLQVQKLEAQKALQNVFTEKSEEIQDFTQKNQKLANDLKLKESELKDLDEESKKNQKVLRLKESELLSKTIECESLAKVIKEFEKKSNQVKEDLLLRQQLETSLEKISKLEVQCEQLTQKNQECAELQNQIEDLKSILKIREKSLENLKFTLNDHESLVKNLNTKESQILKMEKKISELTSEISSKDTLTNSLKNQIESQDSIIQDQETRLKSLEEIPKLFQEKQKISESFEKVQKQSSTLEKLLKEKDDQIKINELKIKELDSTFTQNKLLSERLSKLSTENQDLHKNLQKFQDLASQLEEKEKQLEDKENQLLTLKQLSEATQKSEKKRLEEDFNEKIEVLQVKIESFTSEKKKLQLQLSEKIDQVLKLTTSLSECQVQCESLKTDLSEKDAEMYKMQLKQEEYEIKLRDSQETLKNKISDYEEASIFDKEEISRLNNALLRSESVLSSYKKENLSLTQSISSFESLKKHCDNCEKYKVKISELECFIHSAEESLGGFFINNSISESISSLIASKTQALRKAPRPPLLRSAQKRQSEELKVNVAEELISKSPIITEGSKRSHSSAFSLPDISDLRNELNEEKSENEKYLNQIKLLKEDIRELERRLKRSKDVNEKINSELLTNTLLKLVRNLPFQNTEIESMITLVFTIISVPKEELIKLEPERKSKTSKKFGVF